MRVDKLYNFLFHPMSQPTITKKTASVATIIALSIFSAGTFLLAFGIVSLHDRNIKSKTNPTLTKKVFQNVHPNHQKPQTSQTQNTNNTQTPVQTTQSGAANPNPKIANLKKMHTEQLKKFENWAAKDQWDNFAHAHYDWWVFPIIRSSAGYGDTYALSKNEIELLKSDPIFMQNYRRGVELVLKSWGWDIQLNNKVTHPSPQQHWVGYGVRLGKMGDSLQLFGETELFKKTQTFYTTICVPHSTLEPWIQKIFK